MDLVDTQEALSGLGCRIGELLALDSGTLVDFDRRAIWFHGTVIRVGVGLIVQDHIKTPAGMRRIARLGGSWASSNDVTRSRESPWLFPFSRGTLRDADNTREYIRRVVEGTLFAGLHPHDWRHYLIGVLRDAGLTARQIADHVGHDKPSTSQDVYVERGGVGPQAGLALEDLSGGCPQNHGPTWR
ncbi:tyrosine-type recombinase/integrase [Amycolatopsis keratiniphila]|uniref:Tyr recombinase domain-containing protein n=1 Tax=Amycolatopsis keratiniphila subsp. keratiniphila TaxID=227715 RepID=A0A1W2LS45_9PSEU|nr:tyrosine-type recombinase/integrase [Amycolatopsis keratiniphila]ONF67455.1 hypothetical protein AVR91_0222135 [Amycolatopsis keratiniphila subsp. keratiniphila]